VRRTVLLSLLVLVALPASAAADVSLQKVGDFSEPVQALGAPGDGERLYVVEQPGTIKVFRNGSATVFANLTGDVEFFSEQGLLSMAFPPDFQTSRKLYVYYTQAGGAANRVDEFRAPTGDAIDPTSRRLVISIPHTAATNHNGGQIQFGPDGMLYLAPGDGGTDGAPARDLNSLLGKVLRIDPRGDGDGEYGVPADNPFVGQVGARGEIWASGLRNPFRFSFDRMTGDLVLGDVGEGTTEEIDFVSNADGRGRAADFGWNVCEGSFAAGSTTEPCSLSDSVLPVIDKFQSDGYRSIIPGYVVRDPSLPSLLGRLVYGDFYVDELHSAVLTEDGATDDHEIGLAIEEGGLSGFGEDAAGCVYAASRNGPVYRLVENDDRIPCPVTGAGTPPTTDDPPTDGGPPVERTPPADAPRDTDQRGPRMRTTVAKRQRVLKLKGVIADVSCDERCTVRGGGTLRIGKRRFDLRSASTAEIATAKVVRVKLRLTRSGTRALRRALRDGKPASVRIGLRARDISGNPSRLKRHTVLARL